MRAPGLLFGSTRVEAKIRIETKILKKGPRGQMNLGRERQLDPISVWLFREGTQQIFDLSGSSRDLKISSI